MLSLSVQLGCPGLCSVDAVCIGVENCWVGVFLRQAAFEPGKYNNV